VKNFLALAQKICENHPGVESTQLLCDVHYGLAAVANETNDRKGCLEHTSELLAMRCKMFEATGQADLRLAIAYNEHAIALILHDKFEEAVHHFETSVNTFQALDDYWPGMDTNPRSNLGFTLWWLGRLPEARNLLENLLHDREARFGVMDTESYRYSLRSTY
jgi:Tetratricopeptide repeat